MPLAVHPRRVLLLTAMLVSAVALFAASNAEAHTLSIKKAKKVATAYAKQNAQQYADQGLPVTAYGTGGCERKSRHAVDCIYIVEFQDGAAACGGEMRISFKSKRSRKLRGRLLNEEQCIDAEGNPLEKRALKRAVK